MINKDARVAVVASDLSFAGGAETVTLNVLSTLSKMNLRKTSVYIWGKAPDFRLLKTYIDYKIPKGHLDVKPLGICFKAVKELNPADTLVALTSSIFNSDMYDLVIATDLVPTVAHVWYIHFPTFALMHPKLRDIARYYSPFMRSQVERIRASFGSLLFSLLLKRSSLLLANSSFTRGCLEKVIDKKVHVCYPPVAAKEIAQLSEHTEKEDLVLTVSRFKRFKNLDLIPMIASMVKQKVRFVVIGFAEDPNYAKEVGMLIKKYGVKDRVIIILNCSRSEKLRILSKAKVYLHVTPYEHFGISIVEGMAAGAIPVVHASGGPLIDIVAEQGLYGYHFSDVGEAANHIETLITKQAIRAELAQNAKRKAMTFDENVFKRRFATLISDVLNHVG